MMALRLTTSQVPPELWRGAEETEHSWRYRQADHTEPHGERVHEEWYECSACGEISDGKDLNDTRCFPPEGHREMQQPAQTGEATGTEDVPF